MPTPSTSQRIRRVLAIAPHAGCDDALLTALTESTDLHVVDNIDEALRALREEEFDLVVTPYAELGSLARAAAPPQTERILRDIGQAVCIVDRTGKLEWANAKLESYPPQVAEALSAACAAQIPNLTGESRQGASAGVRRQSVEVGREHSFDLTISPLLNEAGQIERVVGLAWDITSSRRLQERVNAIDDAGRELVGLDAEAVARLDVGERLALLEEKITEYGRELLHFSHFIVRLLDESDNRLNTVLAIGLPDAAANRPTYALAEGNGISGYVAATGRSYICPDVQRDAHYLPGLDDARSSLTIPLFLHGKVIGVLNVESDEVASFSEDDRRFAEIFGRYIAIALNIMQLLVAERQSTSGQIAADVDAEIAAPLNDIVADVASLMDDCAGDEKLRSRLAAIIEDVDRVKDAIHVATEPAAVGGIIPAPNEVDPLLAGKRILVADDEDIIRETIAEVLTKRGAVATMARDGSEAIALIHAQPFDLVLSDIKMPAKNGYEVFAAVRETNGDCPVILITGFGYDPHHSIVRAGKEGLASVLFKPFKVEQLLEEIRHALTPKVTE